MSAVVDRYSRTVLWIKIAFPLIALAMLSILFMIAETFDPDQAVPISDNTLAQTMAAKGLQAPRFSGISEDGNLIDATASSLTPKVDGDGYDAKDISAKISLTEDNGISLSAPVGEIDQRERIIRMGGGVSLKSSLGYFVRTEEILATVELDRIFTTGEVEVYGGPFGEFTSGSVEIIQNGEKEPGRNLLLIFKDGVRLVYIPKTGR